MDNSSTILQPISVLVAVPESEYFRDFITNLISEHSIETIGFAEKSGDIVPMAIELETDIIIIDRDVFKNNLMALLTEINRIEYKGIVIIIYDNYDESVNYIIGKCENVYCIKRPVSKEELTSQIILASQYRLGGNAAAGKGSFVKECSDMEFPAEHYRNATKLLLNLGFSSKHKGFLYIRDAVLLKYLFRDAGNLSKKVYPFIAKRYNVSEESVERAIRNAVDYVWNLNRLESISLFYGIKYKYNDKPSNSVIIAHISDILRSRDTNWV